MIIIIIVITTFIIIFVTNPTQYRVVPVKASRVEGHGITMAKEGEPEPLVQFALRCPDKIKLTDADLRRIANFLDLENITESTPINDLLTALSNFSELDSEHVRKMYWQCQADDDGCELLKDPLMECVYNDLDQGDKDEFKEVGQMIKKKKFKTAMGNYIRKRSNFARHPTAKRRKKGPTPDGPEGPAPPDGIGAPQRPPLAADEPPAGPPAGAPPGGPLALAADEAADARIRGPNFYAHVLEWQTVQCDVCNADCGRYKYHEQPGGRDGPAWLMQVWNTEEGRWGQKAPLKHCFRANNFSEEDVLSWIQLNRHCRCGPS